MLNMDKFIPVILLFFFISGTFATALNPVSASELVEDSWNTKTPMTQARASLGVIAVDGKIYAIGGYSADGSVVGTNERYNPKTDEWVTMTSMPTARKNFAAVVHEGKIYCIGGESKNGITSVIEVYDTVTDKWNIKKNVPFNVVCNIRANVVGGQIFIIHGKNLFIYDTVADVWTQKNSIPHLDDSMPQSDDTGVPSYDFTFVMDNKIIAYFKYSYEYLRYNEKVMIYDIKTDVWSEGKTSTTEGIYAKPNKWSDTSGYIHITASCMTTGVYAPKKVYAFGLGPGPGQPTFINWVYDPVKDTWSNIENIPIYIDQFGVAVVDDILYVIGGKEAFGYGVCSGNEQYVPIGYHNTLSSIISPSATLPPSNAVVSTEPDSSESEHVWSFLIPSVVVATVLTVGGVTALFFYLRGRKRPGSDTPRLV